MVKCHYVFIVYYKFMELNSYKELWGDFKKYITLQVDYIKLTALEKLTILCAALVVVFVSIALSVCALFFLSSAFVAWLDTVLCCTWLAHLITGALVLLILFIVLLFKKVLIIIPITRFITKLFLNPPK